jgi:hypothetical protein
MLLLDKSKLDGYLQLKYPFAFSTKGTDFVNNRLDAFNIRTEGIRTLTPERITSISELVAQKYNIPISMKKVENIFTIIYRESWNLELLKYAMMSVLHDNPEFPDFVLPDDTKQIIENVMIKHSEFDLSIQLIQNCFRKLITDIDYDYIKTKPYNYANTADSNMYTSLGSLLFFYHYIWSILDTTEFEDRMLSIIGSSDHNGEYDDVIVLRNGNRVALFNYNQNKEWTFHDIEWRNARNAINNRIMNSHIDLNTFFKVRDSKFIIHDDVVPEVNFFKKGGKFVPFNEVKINEIYIVESTYNMPETDLIQGKVFGFDAINGCIFKEKESKIIRGKSINQVQIINNKFEFVVYDIDRKLPFKTFRSSDVKVNRDWL